VTTRARLTLQLLRVGRDVAVFHFLLLRGQRLGGGGLARQPLRHEGLPRIAAQFLVARLLVAQLHTLLLGVRRLGCCWVSHQRPTRARREPLAFVPPIGELAQG
jgi:hypothetical protein